MGFNFSSFLAGAAKGAVDVLEEDEKKASTSATFGVKALKENYDKMMSENRKMESEVSENIKALRTFDSTATEAELFAAATNKTYMNMALEAAKTNPTSFKVGHVVKIIGDNESKVSAEEMLKHYTTIPSISETASRADTVIKESGNWLSNLRGGVSERAATKARTQTAEALGVPIEKLQAASGYTRGEPPVKAEFEMGKFQKAKGFDDQVKDSEVKLALAMRTGDPDKINIAKADLLIFKTVKDTLTSEQQQFSNKIADIKNRYMFGDAEERKAAKPEYDKLMADVRAEALAKKVTKDGDGEGKIPALSTLNTFTSAAVARSVAAKHGDLIKSKQLAIVEKADGSVGIDYIGDNDTLRRQILETQANAAKNALSLYTDAQGKPLNRDVASVINSFTGVVPSVMRDGNAPATPAQPTTPARPTLPTPTASVRREAEDAIARGADRAAVAERFKKQTGQEF
jgi:hypothetical protein